MLKVKISYFWFLYLIAFIYGTMLAWLLYVGPITTSKVEKMVQELDQNIIVSLTTTPYRINKIRETLDSILHQSIKPDLIILNIPYHFKRDNIKYQIPTWLNNYKGVVINRTDDFGPFTKLIPALAQDLPPDTIIITVDDDVWYPRHVVRDLVKYSMQHPHAAITSINRRFDLDHNYQISNIKAYYKHGSQAPLIIGIAGAAYRRSFFNHEFSSLLPKLPAACQLSDDLVITMYLEQHNIPIEQTIENSFNPIVMPLTYRELEQGTEPSALSYGDGDFKGNQRNYAACLAALAVSKYRDYEQVFVRKHQELAQQDNNIGMWSWIELFK